ncbi:hypothetical protein C5S53_02745 [Methanophagales archaeon]|nr:hypothetical protein C5S53_02745 [Methanophagales archaeon]
MVQLNISLIYITPKVKMNILMSHTNWKYGLVENP